MPCSILMWVLKFWALHRMYVCESRPESLSPCWFRLPPILNCTVTVLFSAQPTDLSTDSWYRGSSCIVSCGLTVWCVRCLSPYHILSKSARQQCQSTFLQSLYPNSVYFILFFFKWSFIHVRGCVSECPLCFLVTTSFCIKCKSG